MKSSDLRIGNIVAVCYEDPVIPDTVLLLEPGIVHLSNRENADSERDIMGVPLHEDWLRKFNFKYHFNSDEWACDTIVIKRIQNDNANIWFVKSETFQKKIAFVHQLQDLLRS